MHGQQNVEKKKHRPLSRAFDLRRVGRLVYFRDMVRYFVFGCDVIFPFISASVATNPPAGFSLDVHIHSSVVKKLVEVSSF